MYNIVSVLEDRLTRRGLLDTALSGNGLGFFDLSCFETPVAYCFTSKGNIKTDTSENGTAPGINRISTPEARSTSAHPL